MRSLPILAALAASAFAPAQSFVSPAGFANRNGNSNNTFPLGFRPAWTYQQIHTDVPARLIRGIAFRQGGTSSAYVARKLTAEIAIGEGSYTSRSRVFANNFAGRPIAVMARKQVSLPDWTKRPGSGFPAPFNAVFAFDRAWGYTKQRDVCWQLRIFASDAGNANYAANAVQFATTNTSRGAAAGIGCVATGNRKPMTLGSLFRTSYSPATHAMTWSGAGARPNQPGAVLIGLTDPNLAVPGLCARLRVGSAFLSLNLTTTARGSFQTPTLTLPYDPTIVGFRLTSQAASSDPGRAGLPLALSNGHVNSLPARPPKPVDICRIYAAGSATATSGSLTSNYGLITEFR